MILITKFQNGDYPTIPKYVTSNHKLHLPEPTRYMAKYRSCVGYNKAGTARADFVFEILYKPDEINIFWNLKNKLIEKIDETKFKAFLEMLNPLEVYCEANGNPNPMVIYNLIALITKTTCVIFKFI